MASRDEQSNISRLIQAVGDRLQIEDMIGFVACHDGMLECCRRLAALRCPGDSEMVRLLQRECAAAGIAPRSFLAQVRTVASIFEPGSTLAEPYRVLGLRPGASVDEVKRAYRELSIRYHPDTAGATGCDVEKFIDICRAYRRITAEKDASAPQDIRETPWMYGKSRAGGKKRAVGAVILVGLIAAGLLICVLITSALYDRKMMLAHFGNTAVRAGEVARAAPTHDRGPDPVIHAGTSESDR